MNKAAIALLSTLLPLLSQAILRPYPTPPPGCLVGNISKLMGPDFGGRNQGHCKEYVLSFVGLAL
jgi:hypothetical protein